MGRRVPKPRLTETAQIEGGAARRTAGKTPATIDYRRRLFDGSRLIQGVTRAPHKDGRSAYMSNGATPDYLSAGASGSEPTGDACVVRSRCCWGAGVPTGPRFGRVV